MSNKTRVYAHKGYIGISSAFDAEGLINKPDQPGQLGFVVDAAHVEVQAEALGLLKKIPKGRGSFGEIDVFKADRGVVVFGWLGGNICLINPGEAVATREYDPGLLTATEGVETPQDFIDFIDEL